MSEKRLNKFIQDGVNHLEVDEDGKWSIPGNKHTVFDLDNLAISELSGIEKELRGKLRSGRTWLVTTDILAALKSKGKDSLKEFEGEKTRLIKQIRNEKVEKHTCVLPINVKPWWNGKNYNINLFGYDLEFDKGEKFSKFLPRLRSTDLEHVKWFFGKHWRIKMYEYIYVNVRIDARDILFVREDVQKLADMLLSIIRFAHGYNRMSLEEEGPLSRIRNPPFILVTADNGDSRLEIFQEESLERRVETYGWQAENITSTLQKFAKKSKLREKLIEALQLYGSGTIDTSRPFQLLKLWTCIETLLNITNQKIKQEDIKKRLNSVLSSEHPVHRYMLDRIVRLRNDIVHESKLKGVTGADVNFAKFVCEQIIRFFLYKYDEKPNYLQALLTYKNRDKKQLKEIQRAITEILVENTSEQEK